MFYLCPGVTWLGCFHDPFVFFPFSHPITPSLSFIPYIYTSPPPPFFLSPHHHLMLGAWVDRTVSTTALKL